jgi:RNA polymerase sigma-70 factor (ECF subfamily)
MRRANDILPTRQSLLSRLKDWNDQESWKVFFDTYWRLIYNAAVRAGLNDAEARDVVQETVMAVSKNIPEFVYDPSKGSFKTWLMRQTSWRIRDQIRRRMPLHSSAPEPGTSTRTATIDQVADPAGLQLEAVWDAEWEANLIEAAIQRVKNKVDARQFQIFDLYVQKKWPVLKITQDLKINATQVYLAKHRIGSLIKKELKSLGKKPI